MSGTCLWQIGSSKCEIFGEMYRGGYECWVRSRFMSQIFEKKGDIMDASYYNRTIWSDKENRY